MTFCLLHLPDAICLYRACASIVALILGPHPAAPWLFSTALLSDLFDGYIYRKYIVNHPKWRLWWPLPISLDMTGDLSLIVCGIMYACRYLYCTSWLIAFLSAASFSLLGLLCVTLPNIVPMSVSRRTYIICITTLTHISCALMLCATISAWIVYSSAHWFFYASFTIALFYYIFARIGEPSRLIRRPPNNFRKSS